MCAKRGMAARPAAVAPVLCSIAAALAIGGGCEPTSRDVTVRLVDHDALLAAVAAHRGRVVVLDCWSTACPPCVRDFPELVALARKYPGEVACLSLSLDYEGIGAPEDALPRVREFLTSVGAGPVENMLGREESDDLYRKLGLASVPAVFVWGRDGMLARRFDEDGAGRPFTYADVETAVRELLEP